MVLHRLRSVVFPGLRFAVVSRDLLRGIRFHRWIELIDPSSLTEGVPRTYCEPLLGGTDPPWVFRPPWLGGLCFGW